MTDAERLILEHARHQAQYWQDAIRLEEAGLFEPYTDQAEAFLDSHPELVGHLNPSYPPDWTDEDAARHKQLEQWGVLPQGLFPNRKLYAALVAEGLLPDYTAVQP